ncbi:2-amino-4-hydroxy-6-hydroxymethyldihydropteridine diphosphokinase [Novosphingobium album (ex Liu et al. 2023)]|uniref:2-amino-4-hydroxy-6-hydroxymethyldihydropteridine pyrophosphokinase n=1 Tax=Novosphingobium album (ex Liu et al. 2023) TaxID=3031130 RepID=A0ABT5WN14_9SPHN|nr:2-amino-4-hydroxy-6-hydroxymethyldihydropteridine diphosphokinase [Novosphingobium album (ex Liu et al. 2023)]MDE8651429.1 2-amino-4-hydroxy-6-hydroxymethyldihydropteridine diphosphokinase [Novosphingobium album (ex Liu et al. 2023)]
MGRHRYLVALGSNRRHHRHGTPRGVIRAALAALDHGKVDVLAVSPIIETPPLGHSRRRFANAAALVRTRLAPDELLHKLQKLEHKFGRRKRGRRWSARVLDLDIVLWNGGAFAAPGLVVPHPLFRERRFVLIPALHVAPAWRDPRTGLTLRHLAARLTRPHTPPR